jgi:hypothetical protein
MTLLLAKALPRLSSDYQGHSMIAQLSESGEASLDAEQSKRSRGVVTAERE